MTDFGKYKVHPIAALFPAIGEEEFSDLVQHIDKHKLQQPIVLAPDGITIVDGLNRFRACTEAKVKPRFRVLPKRTTELQIIEYIEGANMRRRDLNAGQKTMIRLEIDQHRNGLLEAAAKDRKSEAGGDQKTVKARKNRKSLGPKLGRSTGRVNRQIAKKAGVGHGTVSKAQKVRKHSKKLADEVKAGKKKLDDAYKQVRREEVAAQAVAEQEAPSKNKTIVRTHDGKEIQYALPKGKAKFNQTNDQVSWAKWTWNPVTGCLHNCKYCYAREGAVLNKNLAPFYPAGFEPAFYDYRLEAPYNTKLPDEVKDDPRWGRVFVTSMGDLFGKWVPDDWIEKVFTAAHANQQWEYLFLTKFPQRYVGLTLPPTAWIGTTVDEQYRVKIAEEAFRKIGGVRVKWLSLEPLLAPLEFSDLSMFDFVVIGSQSATDQPDGPVKEFAPPFEWVAKLTEQAKAAGCAVYHKPNLLGVTDSQHAGMQLLQEVPVLPELPARTRQGELELKDEAA